jgi:hypothetical protein
MPALDEPNLPGSLENAWLRAGRFTIKMYICTFLWYNNQKLLDYGNECCHHPAERITAAFATGYGENSV